jgi:hypothetical protein
MTRRKEFRVGSPELRLVRHIPAGETVSVAITLEVEEHPHPCCPLIRVAGLLDGKRLTGFGRAYTGPAQPRRMIVQASERGPLRRL